MRPQSNVITFPAVVPGNGARTGVTIDFGNVGIGYRDGYYDHSHRYHSWHRNDAIAYRAKYHDNYRDMSHNRDHNRSWGH